MAATEIMIIVMMTVIMGVAESIPMPTSMDHGFPDARTTTHARHGHLLHGMLGDLESYVFDDVVEFLFQQLGEELPQARSGYNKPHHNDGGDYYPLPSEYPKRKGTDQSCIAITGYIDSSIICLNIFTALSIAGLALLTQFLFYACVSNLCPEVMNQITSNGTSGGGATNITNIITIDTSNDVSVEQNDNIDIFPPFFLRNRDDLVEENGERSDLDVDANLGKDGRRNDLRSREVRNEQSKKGNSRFKVTINGVEQEDVNGDGVYMHEGREVLRKQTQEHNKEEAEGKTLDQDDTQGPEDKEGGRSFTMHISQDSLIGRLLSWGNWGLSLPSLRYNTNICPMLGRYVQS
ncbi:uncharacterized protein LOC135095779 [Scylla paramamosain]|uniref:uncharacterized protein LOC135095779 n=1 Tax=Scylla paramamosain TaxID=85552 RepID=UPI003082C68E